ncbi:leucine-rich repeat domain-containing protein [Capnocytophaga catalasegens]|uniref:Uncharacterized protein n=1 Tax=Capnocytophaga catalasegens TaxID=1004260 RepID=A0AAV5ATA1_9FLAO|nr:leucine-rich repeat domain-containing protein [Capnocytophaga catalasegens]GIZ16278.1 hypothetical protein RCZ03_22780 [Capnocytophaga catalasegens]GJM49485.1 hypothetical protein RCZ15_04600 [Capnocytophaga catalasegens]GJM52850.1 hypothetical protein RCZ16_11670 [Capnocytophaga catalasegens]
MKKIVMYVMALVLAVAVGGCTKEGPAGKDGINGVDGKDGKDGRDGVDGKDGKDGKNGNVIITGNGVPDRGLGNIGDYYFDRLTTNLYGAKTANGWGTPISLKGLQGEKGDTGEKGDKGIYEGISVHAGRGVPDNSIGKEGDFYIDMDNHRTYGPKKSTGWDTSINTGNSNVYKTKERIVMQANTIFDKHTYFKDRNFTIHQTTESQNIISVTPYILDNKFIFKSLAVGETTFSIELSYPNNTTNTMLEEYEVKVIENTGDYLLSDNCEKLAKWENAKITTIDMPNDKILKDIKHIGSNAFSEESRLTLTSIILPQQLKTIEPSAFSRCKHVEQIDIPNTVTKIGYNAFEYCTSLKTINIPYGITEMDSGMFNYCTALTSVSIPNSIKTVAGFNNCTALTSITIPNSVTKIGNSAFYDCSSLASIEIPNSVKNIGYYAFNNCTALTSITIPNSVTKIEYSAFYNCSSLTSVTIPNSLVHIDKRTFQRCNNLTEINLPNSIVTIDDEAFSYCKSLQTITLPNSIKGLGDELFEDCTSLISIKVEAINPPKLARNNNMFRGASGNVTIYVPVGSVSAYKAAEGWKEYANNIKPIQ